MAAFQDRVFAVVQRIPRGRVASYGLVGRLAGYPQAARHVGMVMRLGRGLPWWRVLGKDGDVRIQDPVLRREQVERLEREGIDVVDGKVDLARYGWRPRTRNVK